MTITLWLLKKGRIPTTKKTIEVRSGIFWILRRLRIILPIKIGSLKNKLLLPRIKPSLISIRISPKINIGQVFLKNLLQKRSSPLSKSLKVLVLIWLDFHSLYLWISLFLCYKRVVRECTILNYLIRQMIKLPQNLECSMWQHS